MASSSDSNTAAPGARSFAQRVEQHERVPRIDLPGGLAKPVVPTYARFIPREELGNVAAWVPDSLDPRKTAAAAAPAPAPIDPAVARAARQAQLQQRFAEVFEQGRRQGQEDTTRIMREEARQALDVFRRQQATEVGAPVATLLTQFQQGLDSVEQALARRLAGIAMQMARQVVRHELQTNAALVVDVTQEALAEVLLSARHITVKVHPTDFALVEQGCADAFEARGARLIADAHVERGGCLVESDLGKVDARLSTRWAGAVAAMGTPPLSAAEAGDGMTTP